ncbi:MAG: twin-arginine translocase TatA/TatE family subunit [Anaerolineae bacterium]|jgi:sec-independent protein translocase protein TatA|nr:twin-arginine translocase TatA/TatE family subunit [Anaerolineae bacterium]
MTLGPLELLILFFIVLLLFGVGRISRVGGELGSAVANFRRGMRDGNEETKKTDNRDDVINRV